MLAIVLLIGGVVLERAAYYGVRSILALYLSRVLAMPYASIGTAFAVLAWGGFFASFLGGAAAIAIGPRATAAAGAACAMLGMGALAVHAPAPIGLLLLTLGGAFVRPAAYAAGAEIVAREDVSASGAPAAPSARRFVAVGAISAALYCGVNIGAFVSSILAGFLESHFGAGATFGAFAAIELVAALLLGGAALAGFVGAKPAPARAPVDPYRSPQARPFAAPPAKNGLVGIALLLGPAILYGLAMELSFPVVKTVYGARWLFSINPLAVAATTAVLSATLAIMAMTRSSVTPLFVVCAGLVIMAVGLLPSAFAGESTIVAALGALITAVGEAAIGPIVAAYAAVATRPRYATLVVSGVLFFVSAPAQLFRPLAYGSVRAPMLVLLAVLLLACGVVGFVFARRLQRAFDPYSNATS